MLEVLSREGTCCYLVGTPFWHGFQSSYYAKTENTNLLLLRTRGPWYEWVITFAKYLWVSNKFSLLQKEINDQSSSIPFTGTNRKHKFVIAANPRAVVRMGHYFCKISVGFQ